MKKIALIAALLVTLSVFSKIQAQPNPGPGNQGGSGTTNDGPTVPFSNTMNLFFVATTLGVAYLANKKGVLALK